MDPVERLGIEAYCYAGAEVDHWLEIEFILRLLLATHLESDGLEESAEVWQWLVNITYLQNT